MPNLSVSRMLIPQRWLHPLDYVAETPDGRLEPVMDFDGQRFINFSNWLDMRAAVQFVLKKEPNNDNLYCRMEKVSQQRKARGL